MIKGIVIIYTKMKSIPTKSQLNLYGLSGLKGLKNS